MKSSYLDSPYPQPVDGGTGLNVKDEHEFVDFLPDTKIRIWYSDHNEFYPTHWHDAMEIIYCESDKYVMNINGKTQEVQKGDILIIPGSITHSLDMKEDCHGFVYLIELDWLDQIPTAALIQPLITHPIFLQEKKSLLYQKVNIILEQIRNEYFSNNNLREILVYSHMLQLLTEIGRSKLDESEKITHIRSNVQKEYIERFNTVLNYINIHFAEDITLEQLAKQFGFSKYHFSRLFHQYTSYCFSDYLTYRRISRNSLLRKLPLLSDLIIRLPFVVILSRKTYVLPRSTGFYIENRLLFYDLDFNVS